MAPIFLTLIQNIAKVIFSIPIHYILQTDFVKFFRRFAGKYDFIIPTMKKSQLHISTIKEHLEKAGTSVPIPN